MRYLLALTLTACGFHTSPCRSARLAVHHTPGAAAPTDCAAIETGEASALALVVAGAEVWVCTVTLDGAWTVGRCWRAG